jgi:hypothetical protein
MGDAEFSPQYNMYHEQEAIALLTKDPLTRSQTCHQLPSSLSCQWQWQWTRPHCVYSCILTPSPGSVLPLLKPQVSSAFSKHFWMLTLPLPRCGLAVWRISPRSFPTNHLFSWPHLMGEVLQLGLWPTTPATRMHKKKYFICDTEVCIIFWFLKHIVFLGLSIR